MFHTINVNGTVTALSLPLVFVMWLVQNVSGFNKFE